MFRRFATLVAALVVALGALATTPASVAASGTSQLNTAYNNYCNHNGYTTEPYGFVWTRTANQVTSNIRGASGLVNTYALWPCVNGTGTYTSKSLLLAVDLQSDPTYDGAYNFVQAGIGKINLASGYGVCSGADAVVSDQTEFEYTPDPVNGNGSMCRAGFVDFNNDGVPDNPVGGRTYFIQAFELDNPGYWRLCFKDTYTGAQDCKNLARTTRDGGIHGGCCTAWWGAEVGNLNNAVGVPYGYTEPVISQSAYQKATDFQWYYTENSVVNTNPWGNGSVSYYGYTQSQAGLGESLTFRTFAH